VLKVKGYNLQGCYMDMFRLSQSCEHPHKTSDMLDFLVTFAMRKLQENCSHVILALCDKYFQL